MKTKEQIEKEIKILNKQWYELIDDNSSKARALSLIISERMDALEWVLKDEN